jgi:hypothetical protein
LSGAAFVAYKTAIAGLDTATEASRRAVFEAATVGDCILPSRLLVSGEVTLARRDESLGTLLSLRPFHSEWFTYCAAVNSLGKVPWQLANWSLCPMVDGIPDSSFLDAFLKRDYVNMDWNGSSTKPGLLHYMCTLRRDFYAAPHVADRYCDPRNMRLMGAFGQALFCGLGFPAAPTPPAPASVGAAAPPAGYSFTSWCEFYATYLEMSCSIPKLEQRLNWLDEGHDMHLLALSLMGKIVSSELFATERVRERKLSAILHHDAEPAVHLRLKLDNFDEDYQRHCRTNPFENGHHVTGGKSNKGLFDIPLRSSRHRKRPNAAVVTPKVSACGGEDDDDSDDEPEELLRGGKFAAKPGVVSKVKPGGKGDGKGGGKGDGKGGYKAPLKPIWLKKDVSLLASNRVWAVDKLAAKFKVKPVNAKCWAYLLNRCTNPDKKMAMCATPGDSAHKSATSDAHVLDGFVLEDVIAEYSRDSTAEERQRAAEVRQKAADHPSQKAPAGRGSGGRGGANFRQRAGT